MLNRLEDRIRELCAQAVASSNSSGFNEVIHELQSALHEHTKRLRKRFLSPIVPERRQKPPDAPSAGSISQNFVISCSFQILIGKYKNFLCEIGFEGCISIIAR